MQIDEGDFKFWGMLVGWGLTAIAAIANGIRHVFSGGMTYKEVVGSVADHEKRLEVIERDYVTGLEHDKMQTVCQRHLTDTIMLAMEKRDREFDKKFSTICQGIAEIKGKLP